MVHKSIEIVQINLHHSKSASAVLCKTLAGVQTAIALIQEPWFVNGEVKGQGGCGRIFHSNTQGKKVRTCVLVKGAQATFLYQQSGEDLTAVKLKVLTEKNEPLEFIAGSAYLPYDSMEPPPTREVEELVKKVKDERLELLLGCDENSHHLGWGSSNTNVRGEALNDFIMEKDLQILNRGKEPTFMDCRRHEVLDITICTTGMARWIPRRNPKDTNWGSYREELFVRIQDVPSRFRNKRDLEHAAERLGEVIRDSYENNCNIKRPRNTKMVSWWNNQLSILRCQLRKAWNKVKTAYTECSRQKALEDRRGLQRKYNKALVIAKNEGWKKFSSGVESQSEASRLVKIL
ncbi:uncharacterized protein [Fopius arisanus]|uniref:Endonuclease/exonuclease/phosphatase domain-containing protein n=1 Tax=Fopius arisanus TaxID=64838 RepID=A0A9R1SZC6_9HYME|nr:PREDICTED: uncharacterized protein LOC105264560 [Fopius arisanus]